jgi:uroporphyrinogen-III synthase
VEPPVVPRFLEALEAAGAAAVRVPAYLTTIGLPGPQCCVAEASLLQQGAIDAIAFSSTAEVRSPTETLLRLCATSGGSLLGGHLCLW